MTGPRQRLACVALVVPDYDAALAFYVGKLSFLLLEDIAQGPDKRWVTIRPPGSESGSALLLAKAASETQSAAIGNQSGGRVFLFLETDNFARDHRAMRTAGIRFEEEPRHEAYGTVAVWRDPWGNRWDLVERRCEPGG